MTAAIRVLVADDHPIVRGGLVALLGTMPGIEVVAQVGDGEAAVREAVLTEPDLAILDLRMPGLNGVQVTRQLARTAPSTAVLVLTMFDEHDLVADALAAGARGYLLKGAEPDEIERAVRAVASGAAILAPEVADALARPARPATSDPFPSLTTREREVLQLIAAGVGNAQIAQRLGIAGKTVGNHVSAIFAKLGVATRAEAIVRARAAGFGS